MALDKEKMAGNMEHIMKDETAAFQPSYVLTALGNTNLYLFHYFPKIKVVTMTERTSEDFQCKRVYYDMPGSFEEDFVYDEDRTLYEKMYRDIDAGVPFASAEFRNKAGTTWCRVTLTTVEWDEEHNPELCIGVVENRSESKNREQELLMQIMQSQILEFLSCGVFAYTLPDHKVLIANSKVQQLFEYGANGEQDFYTNMMNHIMEQDYGVIREAVQKLKNVGDGCEYKIHSCLSGGNVLTMEVFTKFLEFEDGEQFILSVMQDITKQERTNSLLRRERKRYREAIIFNSEYTFDFDVTEGIMVSDFKYSPKALSMGNRIGITFPISYDDQEKRWMEVVKPEFLTSAGDAQLTSQGLLDCYAQGITHLSTEYYSPTEERYFRRVVLLSKDEETDHIMAVVYATDITDSVREETRKQNELAMANSILQKQVEITKSFSSIYFCSWEINLKKAKISEISVPEWAHGVMEESQGNMETAVRIMTRTFVEDEFQKQMSEFLSVDTMAERLKGQSVISCEYLEKQYGWCEANLIPVRLDEDGKAVRAIFAVKGIREEKKLELEAKQALQEAYDAANKANVAKTEFLSSMSHDIRTPMNAIIGMTAIAQTHLSDKEKVKECLSKIVISSKHLLGLINEVLDMNKIESGKMSLNVEEFNLPDLIDNLLTMSRPQIDEKGHVLTVNIQGVEHENVIGDSQRIQQVFMNLMGNAVKYTPEGGHIKLAISEKSTNSSKVGCYEFVFEDDGIGMSEEFLPIIFEPFARAKDARMAKIQGTGLGMPIARNIVHMMNGDIKVESELNKGTRITVTIFLELQEDNGEMMTEELNDLPVLVVDDDETACESTCEILREIGIQGEWVLSGKEAVARACVRHEAGNDFFAVIIDWKMPEMDGIATAKEIRKKIGDEVPLIIISAYDWPEIEYEARAAGVNAFISKPLFKSRVVHVFKNLLGGQAEATENVVLDKFSKENFEGSRALLVEDNELNAEIAGEILGMVGVEVEYAKDGKEAFDVMAAAADGYYDIVFMDIQMPFMNGYEATRAIRTLPGDYVKRVPIIAMTANAFAEDVQAAKSAGMNEHIAKPIDFAQLLKTLNRWLG